MHWFGNVLDSAINAIMYASVLFLNMILIDA